MGECYDKALSGIFIIIICIPLVLQMVYTLTGRQYDLPLVGGQAIRRCLKISAGIYGWEKKKTPTV